MLAPNCAWHISTLTLNSPRFTPAWQRAPVNTVVNNSQWPSAPLTFSCYKLIMTSSVVWLINLWDAELEGLLWFLSLLRGSPLYFSSLFSLWGLTWPPLLLGIVRNNDQDCWWEKWESYCWIIFGRIHVRRRVDKVWHSVVKLCGRGLHMMRDSV